MNDSSCHKILRRFDDTFSCEESKILLWGKKRKFLNYLSDRLYQVSLQKNICIKCVTKGIKYSAFSCFESKNM